MAKHAYHDHLTPVPLFADLNDDELDAVARSATQLYYQPGKILMRQGEVAHEMFVVVEGTLDVEQDGEHVAEIGPGGFAGEIALITNARRNSTVSAKTAVSVLHIDGREFSRVIDNVPKIAAKLLVVIAERMASNDARPTD